MTNVMQNTTSLVNGLLVGGGMVTMLLQTITLVGVIWKGGRWSQKVDGRLEEHDRMFERIAELYDKIEQRVGHLEGRGG